MAATAAAAAVVAWAATLAEFLGPAARLAVVWVGAVEVRVECLAEAAVAAGVWVPMAATAVEFPEPAGCPAVALA